MNPPTISKLEQRVTDAAEAALRYHKSVGPIELLLELRMLDRCHVDAWKRGLDHATPLARMIQCGPEKLQKVYTHFADWVKARGLKPIEASYARASIHETAPLQVTLDGNPESERFFRIHYTAGDLSEACAKKLEEKLNKAPDIAAFFTVADNTTCSECGEPIAKGDLMTTEKSQPVCLACADLDHLVLVPAGNATLSRRSRKYSPLSAVVLEFNRRAKRYERRGILVTEAALAQAEAECAADEGERAERREAGAVRRAADDRKLVDAMSRQILERFPSCPPDEAQRIAAHTAVRGSGRVGRSAAGRALNPRALELAVIAHIRHEHTNYDTLLMQGVARQDARDRIRARLDAVLIAWEKPLLP